MMRANLIEGSPCPPHHVGDGEEEHNANAFFQLLQAGGCLDSALPLAVIKRLCCLLALHQQRDHHFTSNKKKRHETVKIE